MAKDDLKNLRSKIDKIDQQVYALIQKARLTLLLLEKLNLKLVRRLLFISLLEKLKF